MVLESKNFHLKELDVSDISDDYLAWVNDSEITRFLEIKYQVFTKDSLKKFVSECRTSDSKTLWGIYCNKTNKHIGNISITCNVDRGIFDGGYFIGDKEYWGTSAAFEALTLMMKYGFEVRHMRRIIAGAYSNNMNARFLFHKIGFNKEAKIKESYMYDNEPVDVVIYSMGKDRWEKVKNQLGL
jgi:RimJ/RimL family protein N-acetyltransferase